MESLPAFFAGWAAVILVLAHGVVGHRWSTMQMRGARLQATSLVGDEELAQRMFAVVWHIVSATFASSSIVLFLAAFGAMDSRVLLRSISVMYASYAVVAAALCATRLDAFIHPIPAIAGVCILGVTALAWAASM